MMSCQFMIPFATHIDVQIVYLDFSPTSLATAQSRAEARNLKNILWVILNKVLPIFEFIWSVCFTVFALYSNRTSETILPKRSMTRLKTFPALIWDTSTSSTAMVLVRISQGLGLTGVFTGVLHHLKDPKAALTILASLLKEDGGMQLMVYAW